ncbi:MAG: hypothetical protein Q9219_000126 [cf. Caloplaca sp. 3 TL-2023]
MSPTAATYKQKIKKAIFTTHIVVQNKTMIANCNLRKMAARGKNAGPSISCPLAILSSSNMIGIAYLYMIAKEKSKSSAAATATSSASSFRKA